MTARNYGAVRDSETAIKLIERVQSGGKPFAFDIEAGYVGEDKEKAALMQFHPDYIVAGISFTDSVEWARYIPFNHDDGGNVDNQVEVARALWRLLNTGQGIAHNAAYELKGMSRWFREMLWDDPELGQEVRHSMGLFPILCDTMILIWMLAIFDPVRIGKDLKSVAKAAFGLEMTKFDDLFPLVESDFGPPMKRGKIRFARFNTRNSNHPVVVAYACEDSVAALMIYLKFIGELGKEEFMYRVEMALMTPLIEMEMGPLDERGRAQGNMMFDWPLVHKKSAEAVRFADLMGEEILSLLSERLGRVININLNSPKQLAKVLFEDAPEGLGLPVKMRSEKTNEPSTSDDALKVIAKSDPIIKKILEYRQVVKLNGAYLAKFINELNYSENGCVFPNHNQSGALTGRMSVDQVSYQQWPKPYHFELDNGLCFDLNFRDLFITQPGFRIVGFDYANVEMRIVGAMSGERKITDAFNRGLDLHKSTAAATFKVPFDQVTKKQRGSAKTLNFAILYGSGAANIAEMLTSPTDPVTKEDAEAMLADYLAGYPDLAHWISSQKAHGREEKEVRTHFGRKYTIWEHYQPKEWIRAKGDRMTVNAPIQGTAADIIKIAMVRVSKKIKEAGLQGLVRMTLTVHDALEFLVHESVSTQQVIDLLEPCVNFPVKGFPVEIRADWHEGYQWGAVAEVKLDSEKKITGYEMEYELPWAKETHVWEGDSLLEVLDEYYRWEAATFGRATDYYRKHNPDFVLAETHAESPEEAQEASVAADATEDAPIELRLRQTATVRLVDMPTRPQWAGFLAFLDQRPGPDKVRVETPQGALVMDHTHSLTPGDQAELSLLLNGASLSFTHEEVDPDLVFGVIS